MFEKKFEKKPIQLVCGSCCEAFSVTIAAAESPSCPGCRARLECVSFADGPVQVTLDDGHRVALCPDGRWVLELAALSFPADYSNALEVIQARVRAEWPENIAMQEHALRYQMQAVAFLEQLSESAGELETRYLNKVRDEWPEDFAMQVHSYQEHLAAANRVAGF